MFGDMMNKIQQMKEEVEKSKARLDNITVESETEGIMITMTGNRKIKDISIPQEMMDDKEDLEDLEDLLLTALNKAIEKADKVNEAEMAGAAKGMLPNLPFGL